MLIAVMVKMEAETETPATQQGRGIVTDRVANPQADPGHQHTMVIRKSRGIQNNHIFPGIKNIFFAKLVPRLGVFFASCTACFGYKDLHILGKKGDGCRG